MPKLRINPDYALLSFIFLIVSASTIAWVETDQTPPPWDPSDHISTAYDYYRYLAHFDFRGFYREFYLQTHYYAPFVHIITAFIFLLTGASKFSAIFINLLSLIVLIITTYSIHKKLLPVNCNYIHKNSVSPGVFAALTTCCYHFPAWLIHDAFLDYPLMAIVTLAIALLLKSENFTDRKYSITFGIASGLGLLTKQTFAFFLILPTIYTTYKAIRSKKVSSIINLVLATSITLILAGAWYIPHLDDVMEIYRINKEGAINENEAPLFSFMSNVFYLHALLSAQIQLPFALLFISGLVYSLIRLRKEYMLIHLWLLSGLASFALLANKDIRYTVPILPAVAIISVCWLSRSKKGNTSTDSTATSTISSIRTKSISILRNAIVVTIPILSLLSLFNAQWPRPGAGYYIDTPNFRWMVFARNYYGFDHAPLPDDWNVPEILKTVAENNKTADINQPPILGMTVNLPYFNPSTYTMYSRLLATERAGPPLIKVDSLVSDNARARIKDCQFLLIRTGLKEAEWKAPLEEYAQELVEQEPRIFEKLAAFPIPLPNAEAVLYRRIE